MSCPLRHPGLFITLTGLLALGGAAPAGAAPCAVRQHPFVLPAGHESQIQGLLGTHAHGAPLPDGWKLQSIAIRPKEVRCVFSRQMQFFVLDLGWPAPGAHRRSRNFSLCFGDAQNALGGPKGEGTRRYLVDLVKSNDTGPYPWIKRGGPDDEARDSSSCFSWLTRSRLLLIGMGIAIVLLLASARTLYGYLLRVSVQDWILLLSISVFGAALRMLGGPRVPAWVNFHGNELLTFMLDRPDRLLTDVDRHGNTFYASHGLALSILPVDLWTILGVQLALSLAVIPLAYAVTRLWLRDANGARWAAAVAAVLPVPVYYGLTEVHMVPGTFFLMLTLGVLGLALRAGRPLLMFSAGLWAVVTSQAYPTLMVVPVLLLGLVASVGEGRALLHRPWIWAAGATALALWLLPAWEYLRLMVQGASGSAFGPDHLRSVDPWLAMTPSSGFSLLSRGNVFLNPSYTPPLFALAALAAVLPARKQTGGRAPVLVLLACALLLIVVNMLTGNLDGARIQLVALPLYCVLAGIGLAWLTARLTDLLRGHLFASTTAMTLVFVTSLALWPGPIGQIFTPQAEARAFLALLPQVPRDCIILSPFRIGRFGVELPAFHLEARSDIRVYRVQGPRLPPALREAQCVVYFRTTACFDRSHVPEEHKAPTTPDGRILPCATLEDALGLQPIALKEIPARPDCRQIFTRQRIPVGFFRVTRLPSTWPPGSTAPVAPEPSTPRTR